MVAFLRARPIATNLLLAVAYAAIGHTTLTLGEAGGIEFRRVIWASSGFAVAAGLLLPFSVWWGIALGGATTTLLSGDPLPHVLLTGTANAMEVVLAVGLLRRARFDVSLRSVTDVLLLLADRVRGNVRDLEGCLVRLFAWASLARQEITLDLAEEVLGQYVGVEPDHLTPERILATAAEKFGARVEMLIGQRRTQAVALPRQVAMYLMRQLTDLSLAEIGRAFGGRDHTTVIYACEKIARRINTDDAFRDKINGLISTLASG